MGGFGLSTAFFIKRWTSAFVFLVLSVTGELLVVLAGGNEFAHGIAFALGLVAFMGYGTWEARSETEGPEFSFA